MKSILYFLLIFTIMLPTFSESGVVLPELINPSMMFCDGQNYYILDGITVYIYSKQALKLLHQVGKRGEGPGELVSSPDLPVSLQLHQDNIVLNSFNKIIFFSKTGKMIWEKKIPFICFQIIPIQNKFAVTKFNRHNDGSSVASVILLDRNLKELKTLYSAKLLNDQGRGKIAFPLLSVFIQCYQDKIFVFDQKREFIIDIFDIVSNKTIAIKREYEKIPITKAYKKEKSAWLKLQPAIKSAPQEIHQMIYFLEFLPVMRHFIVKQDKIFIQTSRTQQSNAEFFILSLSGKMIKELYLPDAKIDAIRANPAATYTFHDYSYHYLKENEDEEWELHVKKIK